MYSVVVGCQKCGEKVRYYDTIDPRDRVSSHSDASEPTVYIMDAPEHWRCRCGTVDIPLTYLKRGMHDLFRWPDPPIGYAGLSFRPMYERGQLRQVFFDFQQLIAGSPAEEDVQKFLEEHPVLWAFLSPALILHKPAILTHKKADFAILTSNKVLYLVEIEKPQTQLCVCQPDLAPFDALIWPHLAFAPPARADASS